MALASGRSLAAQPARSLRLGGGCPARVLRATRLHGSRRPKAQPTAPRAAASPAPRVNKWVADEPTWAEEEDQLRERGRKALRSISSFTWARWASHRSVDRYWRHISGIFQSNIVRGLAGPLAYVAAVSAAVCGYEAALREGALPPWAPSFLLPVAPFDLTSFALSLLLVFRTDTSYTRWEEVCTTWGGIANRSRDTVRQLVTYLACEGCETVGSITRNPGAAAAPTVGASILGAAASAAGAAAGSPGRAAALAAAAAAAGAAPSCAACTSGCGVRWEGAGSAPARAAVAAAPGACAGATGCCAERGSITWQLAAVVARWVVAYSRALKAQVTEDSDLEAELREVLSQQELQLLLDAHHRRAPALPGRPSFALSVLSELLAMAPLRESNRSRIDQNLTFFEDAVGTCERILRTPIPLSYTRHTSRFMVIWLTLLPLGLVSTCGLGTIPLAVIIAFVLLGIEEIGVQASGGPRALSPSCVAARAAGALLPAIEEPFGILPLEDLCAELEGDLFAMLDEAPAAKKTAAAAAAAALAAAGAAPPRAPAAAPVIPAPQAPAPAQANAAVPFSRWPRQLGAPQAGAAVLAPRQQWAEAPQRGNARRQSSLN
eukprot:scaffold12.g8254.t1